MTKFLAALILLAVALTAFLLLQSSPEKDVRIELSVESEEARTEPERQAADLAQPETLVTELGRGDSATPLADRTDAKRITLARLIVNVSGIVFPLELPIILRACPLGDVNSVVELELPANGRHEFEVTDLVRSQIYATPTIDLTVDDLDFYVWEEMLDGVSESTPERVVTFEADITLEPLRAILAGRVWAPVDHEEEINLAVYQFDPDSNKIDVDYLVQAKCDKLGNFRFKVEDPQDCILVAHSEELRSSSLQLHVLPGTAHENLALTLERGSTLSGVAFANGSALAEGTSIEASLVRDSQTTLEIGETWFEFNSETKRFMKLSTIATVGAGGAFELNGLEEAEYRLRFMRGSALARHGKTFWSQLAKLRAPQSNLQVGMERESN